MEFETRMPKEQIVGAQIPGEDVLGWMQTLRECGFSDTEINRLLSRMNLEYFRALMTKSMTKEFEAGAREIEKLFKGGKPLTPDERKKLLESYRSFLARQNRI